MSERRNKRRTKSFLRGLVYVSHKQGAMACLIRDLSDSGARIIFSDTVTLPDTFELHIPQRHQTLCAHVSWRRHDEIGLAFNDTPHETQPAGPVPTESEVVQRIATLEAELVSLRALLAQLKDATEKDATEAVA